MTKVLSFAIGDQVSYRRNDGLCEGVITATSISGGHLSYAIDGCAWFNQEENSIKLVARATEATLSEVLRILAEEDANSNEDDDDLDDEDCGNEYADDLDDEDCGDEAPVTYAIKYYLPKAVYWFDRIHQSWAVLRNANCEFDTAQEAHGRALTLLAGLGASAQLNVVGSNHESYSTN